MNNGQLADRERALRDDIRLVGRVLGDTIRQQQGEAVFATVERIRQISIAFRREGDAAARRELEATLDSLSHERTIEVVRAFSYFSHLANIAEDQHSIRCMRAQSQGAATPVPGTIEDALVRLRAAGVPRAKLQALFDSILVSPVLTAHPTEVRRKSVLDRENEVANLLAERDRSSLTPAEAGAANTAMSRAILTLWQTSLLRRGQPTVIDEVASGLSYYDHTFLLELPRLYGDLEDGLAASDPGWNNTELPSFIRMGSWIGGDRDGNPFVNAEVLRQAIEMQSKRVVDFYLDELHLLGAELSLDRARVSISAQLQELVGALSRRVSAPCGRAVPASRRRHLRAAGRDRPRIGPGGPAAPRGDTGAALRGGRRAARRPRRALSLAVRQRLGADRTRAAARIAARGRSVRVSPRERRSAAEFAGARAHFGGAVQERRGRRLCADAGAGAHRAVAGGARDRPAADLPVRDLFAGDGGRARHPAHGGGCPSALRQGHRPQLRHLDDHDRLRHFGSGAAAERGRVAAAGRRQARRQHRAAVRDDRRSAQLRRGDGRAPRHPRLCAAPAQPGRRAGGHARLFRQQQGRRLFDVGLGALQGRGGADRCVPARAASSLRIFHGRGGRSVAAAARATRRSWRSPRAPCRRASASPNRARSLPESISIRSSAGRTSTTSSRACWRWRCCTRRTGRRVPSSWPRWRSFPPTPTGPTARWCTKRPDSTDISGTRR